MSSARVVPIGNTISFARHNVFLSNLLCVLLYYTQVKKTQFACIFMYSVLSIHQLLVISTTTRFFHTIMSNLENAKRIAAYKAVDEYVKTNTVIGVGSGSTIIYGIDRIAQKVEKDNISLICVPTSFQSRQLLLEKKLPMGDLETHPNIDVCIDGADEVDGQLNLIKGGGGCLLQEKIVASCSKEFIIVADYSKNSARLGDQYKKGIPIEVVPMAYIPVRNKIKNLFGGELQLRMAVAKAGPVVTDNGNFILDWRNFNQDSDWENVNREIIQIPGVIETGLFIKMAKKVFFGMQDGSIKEQI